MCTYEDKKQRSVTERESDPNPSCWYHLFTRLVRLLNQNILILSLDMILS